MLCRNGTVPEGQQPPKATHGPTGPLYNADDELVYDKRGTLSRPKRERRRILRPILGGIAPALLLVLAGVFAIAMVMFVIDVGSSPDEPRIDPQVVATP